MTKTIYHDWGTIDKWCQRLALEILKSSWRPDYIVGIVRGGLTPAVILSHLLDVPMYSLKVQLRDGLEIDCDHNCWMSDDAFGYDSAGTNTGDRRKKILIVDDINDTGSTIKWIKNDWRESCLPRDPAWDDIWGENVRFAVLVNNLASSEEVSWYADEINKEEDPSWIVFPWES
jgi:uncharacterized protein